MAIARAGEAAGCTEALFTLGDLPEERYTIAKLALSEMGAGSTIELLEGMARLVLNETNLLPHLNAGVLSEADIRRLRPVSASAGLMLESASERLCERGGPHFGSPDKAPERRLRALRAAGSLRMPMTSGILIGIGETRRERVQSLLALREIQDQYGNLQELIIQNFRAKPGTKMAHAPEPSLDEQLWTIAVARLLFGSSMSIQSPPNLRPEDVKTLPRAGVNDWGGVSPVTPDHVNPEAPWPTIQALEAQTAAAGRELVPRLPLVPSFALRAAHWCDAGVVPRVVRAIDARGAVRQDAWQAGAAIAPPKWRRQGAQPASSAVRRICTAAARGRGLDEAEIVRLFDADGRDFEVVVEAADALRQEVAGETVTFVVNRNINYTNICKYHCGFCAFSKGRGHGDLRGPAYDLDLEEISRRAIEAATRGATEVCLQGGIHPRYTGDTYLAIVAAVKAAAPALNVHAFSPLEVLHGARTLGLDTAEFLRRLREAGLSTLPGTAAEILDDEVRAILCPDKLGSAEWVAVLRAAHSQGLRSTATIMFGHVDRPAHWARHLLQVRALQAESGGITEFVPLPFVHMESPLWRRGIARSGPTFREAILMHAVSRLALHPVITNIQTSWVKMGSAGAARCLQAGANDLGGTLMNESITRAAGGVHGQEMDAASLTSIAASVGRSVRERTTQYGVVPRHLMVPRRDPASNPL
jgi:FO synthase